MSRREVHELGTILSIWAHPDDETYLAGGLMAAAVDAGQRVVCVSATAGERGTDDPATWPPERLGPLRRAEAAAAMEVLGVGEHRFLDLPDGALIDHEDAGRRAVAALLEDVRPDTVVTFGPDGMTFHPDHQAVHRWVTTEWDGRGRQTRLLHATTTEERLARYGDRYEEWGVYMTDDRPTGVPTECLAVHLCLDGAALARKVAALRAMPSQTATLLDAAEPAVVAALLAEEAFVDAN